MLAIEPLGLDSADTLAGLVVYFIVNVIINLFLIDKIFKEKKRVRNLERQKMDHGNIVGEFLQDQHNQTQNINRDLDGRTKLDKAVVYLRSGYLRIEKKALGHTVGSADYWEYINSRIQQLIKSIVGQMDQNEVELQELQNKISMLKQKVGGLPVKNSDPKARHSKNRIISILDGISSQCMGAKGDRVQMLQQIQKIEHVVRLFEDPDLRRQYTLQRRQNTYLDNSQKHLNTLKDNYLTNENSIQNFGDSLGSSIDDTAISEELKRFRKENDHLNQYVDQLKGELRAFQERIGRRESPALFIEKSEGKKVNPSEIYDLSDEILAANEKEIDRLRGVISNQRRSITEMEESLTKLNNLGSQNSEHRSEIEKLQRCIQESEICISMLESELEELKNDLNVIRSGQDGPGLTSVETHQLDEEFDTIKMDLERALDMNQRSEALIEFLRAALNTSSVEDLSFLIYERISSLNCLSSIIVKGPERFIELAQQNSVPTRDKLLINNMQFNEINPGLNGQISFRFLNIAGVVRPNPGEEIRPDDQSYIIEIIRMSDRVIGYLAANFKARLSVKNIDNAVNTIKQTSFEMDKMLDEYAKKVKKVLNTNFSQIQDISRAKGLGATLIASFGSIEQEAIRQLEAEHTMRLKLRKQFLALLNQMEQRG